MFKFLGRIYRKVNFYLLSLDNVYTVSYKNQFVK